MTSCAKLLLAVALAAAFFCHDGVAHGAGPVPADMVLVAAGEFLMGSSAEEIQALKKEFGKRDLYKDYSFDAETPKRKVKLRAYYIDVTEVTNKQYLAFVSATKYPAPFYWTGGNYPAGRGDSPVLYVSKKDAEAYAAWMHKRLPTEEEWEKAARGTDGRVFPWGSKFEPDKAATADSSLELVLSGVKGGFSAITVSEAPGDISPYGVHDMAGNVREWTCTLSSDKKNLAIVKGASWVDLNITARAAYRELVPVDSKSHIVGFRCVKDVE